MVAAQISDGHLYSAKKVDAVSTSVNRLNLILTFLQKVIFLARNGDLLFHVF